ncbi:tetratricopeptide (TPR) repeat protein [Actinoplanes campanulatus]|uniref:Tetratricopeptide (TPR) repeat protein n=1 Tax=Actinoplanes campanulatus TaxID=113559 RepID=A0A7W5AMR7_9ACTN|nr:FxSxx-COOH system tetratricopeptide repeat protein [Actinoplanes campanulatus]MBB3099168.1 tetratricopeptide (TPR) repeat protein [Actinoplanes campanulatus]
MPIDLPGVDRVPEGNHRRLLIRLHRLYNVAGRPATRAISQMTRKNPRLEPVSHETVSALFRGDPLPAWSKIRSIIIVLCRAADQPVDVDEELSVGVELCSSASRSPAPRPEPEPEPEPEPHPWVEIRPPEPVAEVIVHGRLPERDPFFTGREPQLDLIHEHLTHDPHVPVVVHGPLGVGKTQLIAEYARLYSREYPIVWWVDARDLDRATTSLVELAKRLGIVPSPDRRQTLDRLFAAFGRARTYLLVFDGLRGSDIRALIRTISGSVIVTTRDATWARDSAYRDVEVPDFDPGEVAQYLRKRGRDAAAADAFGRMPLALAEFCRHPSTLSIGQAVLAEVRSALARLGRDPGTVRLLTLLAGFGAGPIQVPLLATAARREVPAELRALLKDQIALRRRLAELVQAGLARRGPEDGVEIPALIRLAVRDLLPDAAGERNRDHVREILVAADPGHPEDRRTWPTHRAIAAHVGPSELVDWHHPAAYRTVRHQIRFRFLDDDIAGARRLGERVETALAARSASARTDEAVLQIRRYHANALRAAGRYTEAEALTAEMTARLAADPAYTDHPVALDLARGRGHDLRIAGHYQRAFELDEETLRGHLRFFPEDDYRTSASRYNRGVSLRLLGRFGDAYADDEEAYVRLQARIGVPDGAFHRLLNAIAEDLYGLGRYREIGRRLTGVLTHGKGRELLRARRMSGVAARRLGDPGGAAEELAACHQACLVRVGVARELTLAVAMSWSGALREFGRLREALDVAERAEQQYEQALGAENPLVQVARVNVVATLLAMGRAEPARQIGSEAYVALRGRLGAEHPFTVAAVTNLASAMSLEDPASARGISEEAYRSAREVYGESHPDTLLAGANFAADGGASPSLDAVLGGLRRGLGAGHPAVLDVARGVRAIAHIEPPSA